ncbi:calcium/sodium antiporter [Rhodovulum adriaticum]|uniref:Cation:H+ antiporter n=1 Tax=Rhodovulum adriaticum TaxID=35804 RepID=A0A4R2NIL5_RHOAD|nr:calcium/sodium antiporter [Rhodovulum adriaticum]MBK1636632.1 sodium:proton exchanger [Rhodovulum adriaticum]TCP21369.1 cation:H+ antiporter [Rhodovulum adriaticum]
MTSDLLTAALGLALLLFAGDSLVKGAVNMSLRLGVPALIVSLTIVAFGTSAPEMLIAVQAVLDDAPGIAMGNVVGSNIANVLLVLGVPALMTGLRTDECDTRRTYLMMIGASLLFIALCMIGPITWMHGAVLLAALSLILFDAFRAARKHRRETVAAEAEAEEEELLEDLEGVDPSLSWFKIAMFLLLGLIGLPLGADLLVDSSTSIARDLGVSETVIGLTLVAVGTSLPELATTVMAAMRRQADVALGNVIGSNMFNLLAIVGVASLVGTIPLPPEMLRLDLWVMLGTSALLAPFVFLRWPLNRAWGTAFLLGYAGYLGVLLI